MTDAYWNAVENNPEAMGFDPANVPKRPQEKPEEPVPEDEPKVEIAPTPTAPPAPQPTPSAVYVVMPQTGANVQALIPDGYRLISDEEYNKLKRYKTLYKKERAKAKNDEEDSK